MYKSHNKHFYSLKQAIPRLKGIAIFDSDGKAKNDQKDEDFCVLYWKRYELENYFITPKTIFTYIKEYYKNDKNTLWEIETEIMKEIIYDEVLRIIFRDKDEKGWNDYKILSEDLQDTLFQNSLTNTKMSDFAERVFKKFSERTGRSLLRKGDFYILIDFLEKIPSEVKEKLDIIQQYLQPDNIQDE